MSAPMSVKFDNPSLVWAEQRVGQVRVHQLNHVILGAVQADDVIGQNLYFKGEETYF